MSLTVIAILILFVLQCCNSQDFVCCDGAIRLSSGSLSNEGRVEMCRSGQWKTVCDNNWSENEARVVCRQLGYTTQGVVPLIHAAFGMGIGMIVEQIRCNGTERRMADCAIRDVPDGECNHNEDAGVRCACRNGDLRLQGSALLGRGHVEVCLNNVWGTICDDSWNSADANVVCNQLGFSRFGASAYYCCTIGGQGSGQGSGPVHMTNVRCIGNESTLTDCPHTTSSSCHHGEDASVQCRTSIVCHDGDVRLANGWQPYEGRVEVCFNETWGTVCDYIYPWRWNTSQADIVCQQLGYSRAEASTFGFGRGSLSVLIKYVYCRGYESNLGECTYSTTGLSDCGRYGGDIIGVRCISKSIQNGEVRLTNGLHKYAGRVEMYWNSEWRTVCSDDWDELDAQVICRQLNYLSTSVQVQATSYKEHHKRNSVQLTDVGCNSSEHNLTSCCASEISHNLYCHSGAYAGVKCAQCIENSTQLDGELSLSEGYVLICREGDWGKIGYGNVTAAMVVCRQLGFSTENAVAYYFVNCFSYFDIGIPIVWWSVECTSAERLLSQCNHFRSSSIFGYEQFGVRCQTTVPGAPQSVQVSNTTSSTTTLTWSPPLVSDRHGLRIFGYIINCSTDNSFLGNKYTDILNVTLSNLEPFTTYNCCIAANSSRGRGKFACVTLPTRAPTKLKAYSINSTTLLLSWRTPDADEYSHSQQYHVEVTDNNSGQMSHYITENTHLLFNKSRPNHQYAFRVAAYTNRRGPFSQYSSITLHSLTLVTEGGSSAISFNQDPLTCINTLTLSLASILGLVSFVLLIAVVVASFYISYKLCKRQRKISITRPAQVPVYEMVDMPPRGDYRSRPENHHPHKPRDVNVERLILRFDQRAGQNQAVADEENTYQPLIPPRLTALGDDKSEYQSLTQKTLPTKFNVPPGPAPPAIPPKSKATSAITQGSVQQVKMQY